MSNIQEENILQIDCHNPQFNNFNLTNRVLIATEKKGSQRQITFYCPVYMRIKIRNFSNLDIEKLSCSINMKLQITINFRGLPPFLIEEIKSRMVLRFNRDDPINLTQLQEQSTLRVKYLDETTLIFTIKTEISAGLDTSLITFSPIEIIKLILTVSFQQIYLNKQQLQAMKKRTKQQHQKEKKNKNQEKLMNNSKDGKKDKKQQESAKQKQQEEDEENIFRANLKSLDNWASLTVYFNLMDFKEQGQHESIIIRKQNEPNDQKEKYEKQLKALFHKVSWTEQSSFGQYQFAPKALEISYNNEELFQSQQNKEISKKKKNKNGYDTLFQEDIDHSEILAFRYAHFSIPLYKIPISNTLTFFVPMFLLSLTNICVFFTQPGLADRVASLAALMIGFVALTPVIRQALPPNPQVAAVEVLMYMLVFTLLLCLIESLNIMKQDEETFEFDALSNGYFIATLVINLFVFCVVLFGLMFERFYLRGRFLLYRNKIKQINFNYLDWYNEKCDQHFRRKFDSGEILMLETFNRRKGHDKKN